MSVGRIKEQVMAKLTEISSNIPHEAKYDAIFKPVAKALDELDDVQIPEGEDIEDYGVLINTQSKLVETIGDRKVFLLFDMQGVDIKIPLNKQSAKHVYKVLTFSHHVYVDARADKYVDIHLVERPRFA